ncbi:MAG: DUF6020 family protein [Bacillus sp. (in: Bacteria)]|nr:DUF6020 family protein [Bacillus sp. (in: firmicutes)]MCM1425458.1 DUF6020 family protein [Eubacterium sp.]
MIKIPNEDNIKIPSKRQFCVMIPFAVIYTCFIIFGNLEKASGLSALHNAGRILCCLLVSYVVLFCLCFLLSNRNVIMDKIPFLSKRKEQQRREGKWYVFLIFVLICLVCYLPYFLMYFPTWLSNDSVWQIEQILGLSPASNHHPYFHTLIIKFFFMIGYRLFGTYTAAIAFYTFWQVVMMSLVYAFILYQFYQKGTRLIWLVAAFLFYAALPVNGMMTIYIGKDELFSALFLLFTWLIIEQMEQADEIGRKSGMAEYSAYFIMGFFICVLRSNGVFIFLGTALALLLTDVFQKRFARGNPQRMSVVKRYVCIALALVCYLIYHGPMLSALQVEQPDTIEGLTMPTQHILCAYLKGGTLAGEEIEMIERVVPIDKVGEYYNPYLFDIVKAFIREEGNQQAIAENKGKYFGLWLRVGLRNPLQYVVAEVRQTMGYWAYKIKDYQYLYGEYFMVENPFGVETERKFFTYDNSLAMDKYLRKFEDFANKVWSMGLNTWLMVFALAYAVYHKKSILPYVPCIMLLATLLLATPVYNEFRYAYGLFLSLPLLLSYSFRSEKEALA